MQVLRPLGERVVVELLAEEKTAGGLVIPDTAQGRPVRARVVAVGSGRLLENGTRVPPEVAVDQEVLVMPDAGLPVRVQDREYRLVRDEEILAVLEHAPALA
ncbi:chaperonin small subunit [Candidatus Hydrogenisulfobacillus filiaventi]|uniref:Co-chaperonin GroES n=1 Tax=Candidatus Hydrogenisulfobacillus filiaventi TaxID=2707344 RepID=A0A6F8ZH50_9FIRM|nr:co-chaperone GroES [Bacillota bacterium]CAB1129270.1 chaperonin small subunit [Candidatus Hydrogenisulfobacillus filiaventi]